MNRKEKYNIIMGYWKFVEAHCGDINNDLMEAQAMAAEYMLNAVGLDGAKEKRYAYSRFLKCEEFARREYLRMLLPGIVDKAVKDMFEGKIDGLPRVEGMVYLADQMYEYGLIDELMRNLVIKGKSI